MKRLVLVLMIGTLGVAETAAATTQQFAYTGGEQVFVVPAGVTEVTMEAVGGKGGDAKPGAFSTKIVSGGFGAVAKATFGVTPGQQLYVYVGGNGGEGYEAIGEGGFNGGGDGGAGNGEPIYTFGSGGGGASDVSTGQHDTPVGAMKLIVAGGGGGAGHGEIDGAGAGGAAGAGGGDGLLVTAPCTPATGGGAGSLTSPGEGGIGAVLPDQNSGGTGGKGGVGVGGSGGVEYDVGGAGGGGGGGLYGGGGGGGGAAPYPGILANCPPGGGGGGSSGFAPGARDTSVAIDQTGVPSVTFTYTVGQSITLTRLSLTKAAFRVGPAPKGAKRRASYGTAFRFNLSIAAQVSIALERRKVRPCGKGKCSSFKPVTTLAYAAAAGPNKVAFTGRYGKRRKPLKPGRYRATVTAIDPAGQSTPPRQVSFRVLAPDESA